MRNTRHFLFTLILVLTCSAYLNLAVADENEEIIKYRQQVMKSSSANLKMIKGVLLSNINQQHLLKLATALADSAVMMNGNFPEGTDFGDTDAKEDIWENKADFDAKVKDYEKATSELLAKVKQNAAKPELMTAFKAVGKNCKSCHKKYREK